MPHAVKKQKMPPTTAIQVNSGANAYVVIAGSGLDAVVRGALRRTVRAG